MCGEESYERGVRNAECGVFRERIAMTGRLKERTRRFALAVIRLVEAFPRTATGRVIGDQLLRSSTSVAANYRAASRARSHREFVAKLGIVEEEGDETLFWLELVTDCRLATEEHTVPLCQEGDEIVAMVVASIRTARRSGSRTPHSALRTPHS